METIGEQKIWSFTFRDDRAVPASCTQIRHGPALLVSSFMELARKIAELHFLNRDYVLLFRGQDADHKTSQQNTSLRPPLFRLDSRRSTHPAILRDRFERLRQAEVRLVEHYRGSQNESERLKRHRILRWSILQHYEVCRTPLLDVTHSLRIAASFASVEAKDEAFVYVLGVPNLSGVITASAEAGLQIIRLSSVCPPAAMRPHIQEGYLLGEYPEMFTYDQKQNYALFEIDFGRRLVAKFRFDPRTFWKDDAFPRVETAALYPNNNDPLYKLMQAVKGGLPPER